MEVSGHCSHQTRDGRAVCQRLRELLKASGRINRSTNWSWKRAPSSPVCWYRNASCFSGTRLAATHAKPQSRPSSCELGWLPGSFASQDEFHQYHGITATKLKGVRVRYGRIRCCDELFRQWSSSLKPLLMPFFPSRS